MPFRAGFALVLMCFAAGAWAQAWPGKTVRMIVGFSPGGSTDVTARIIAQELTKLWNQQVVVDNRPGASGMIGAELAAKAPPDGYTLLLMTITNAVGMSLYPNLKFDLVRDFAPVTKLATTPHVLVVHPSLPVNKR
jgi:tripartite-type tricarboxylate transporter receptor subunit TctC